MMQIDPAALGDWAAEREKRLYDHLLLHPYFPASITAVDLTRTPYQVQIQRLLETSTDRAWYACPTFIPRVGDQVVVAWQEDGVAVVCWLLSRVAMSNLIVPPVLVGAGNAASLDFSNIPQNFNHLELVARVGGTDAAEQFLNFQFNYDTGNHYSSQLGQADGTATNVVNQQVRSNNGSCTSGAASGTGYQFFNSHTIRIPGYSLVGNANQAPWSISSRRNGANHKIDLYTHAWTPGVAANITSIQVSLALGSIINGSCFWLYGWV